LRVVRERVAELGERVAELGERVVSKRVMGAGSGRLVWWSSGQRCVSWSW